MMLPIQVVFIVFFIEVSYSLNEGLTPVSKCKDGQGLLPKVNITTDNVVCTKSTCKVIPGKTVAMDLSFISPGYVPSLTPKIMVTAIGVTVPYSIGQDDACVGITNTACPLVEKEPVFYNYKMDLDTWFPSVLAIMEFSMINDDDKQVLMCFSLNLQVQ